MSAEASWPVVEVPKELRERCQAKAFDLIRGIHVALALQTRPASEINGQHTDDAVKIFVFSRCDRIAPEDVMRYSVRVVHRHAVGYYPGRALELQLHELAKFLGERLGISVFSDYRLDGEDQIIIAWHEPLPPEHAWTAGDALASIRSVFFPEQLLDEVMNNA